MDSTTLGLAGSGLVLILLALRVPLAFALIGVSALGAIIMRSAAGGIGGPLFLDLYDLVRSPDLAALPLFVALANIAFYTGLTTRVYDAASVWLARLPGGLALASVIGCGGFAAISGSSVGCASTMGRICVPEMLRAGYDPRLATASVAAGGTLGALIPPSVLFILFGIFTDSPIAGLFLAGLLPGLLSLAGMCLVIAWWVAQEPGAAPPAPRPEGARLAEAALAAWPALLVFVIITGGLLAGLVTPTGAAALSVALTVAIGFAQRRLSVDVLWRAIRESIVQSAVIALIAAGGKMFADFVASTGVDAAVTGWLAQPGTPFFAVIAAVVVLYLILGMLLDPVTILVLTLPFLFPLVEAYDMNPLWFGVVLVKLLEIGMITPPVGLNVFVIGNVAREIGIDRIFAGVTRFLMIDLLVLLSLVLFPILSTLIPSMMWPG